MIPELIKFDLTLKPGIPNSNGVIYSKEVCESIVKQVNEGPVKKMIVMEPSLDVNIEKICGRLEKVTLEDGKLVGHVRILNVPAGEFLRGFLAEIKSPVLLGGNYLASTKEGKVELPIKVISFSPILGK